MGKKSKKNKTVAGNGPTANPNISENGAEVKQETMSRQTKRETLELVNQLLEKCSCPLGTGAQEWKDFMVIYDLIERIKTIQKGNALQHNEREKHFDAFKNWLHESKVDTSFVDIGEFEEGCGLKANRDIERDELMLEIPRKLMMTTETAAASCLKSMIQEDRILQAMPNIVMALHVLCEKMSGTSFWKPYLDILPVSYTTPLYFAVEELQLLKGSPAQSDMLNQFRNIARQYAYFFKLFRSSPSASKLPLRDFCYEDYRWAVSTVMTRQNQIPSSHSDAAITALIPLWDMCNHCNGKLSTDFNVHKDASQCYAFRPFSREEQIFIFYGSRSNAELLIHNGFVYLPSQCDRMSLKLGISKNDPLCDKKAQVLAKMNILPSRMFFLYNADEPVDSELLAFLRVFVMDEEELDARLTGKDAKELHRNLRDFTDLVSEENEIKSWNFLGTRLSLLLRTYGNIEETTDSTSPCRALAINLLVSERRILTKVKVYCDIRVEKVKTKQNLAPVSGGQPASEPIAITEMDDDDDEEEEEVKQTSIDQGMDNNNQAEKIKDVKASYNSQENGLKNGVDFVKDVTATDKTKENGIKNGIDDVSEDLAEIQLA